MRDLTLSPNARAWAEDLVANAVAALQRPEISAEEAFGTYQALMQNLQPVTWLVFWTKRVEYLVGFHGV